MLKRLLILLTVGFTLSTSVLSIQAQEKISVVTSTSIIAEWVREVGGEYVNVVSLISGRANPHTYEPTASDIMLLKKADLYMEIGLGLETWSRELIKNSDNPDLTRLILSDKLPTFCRFGPLEHQLGTRRHTVCNPHIWLDDRYAPQAILVVSEELTRFLPEQAEYFRCRAIEYKKKVEELFAQYRERVAQRNLKVVTVVPTYTLFLKSLGITEIGPLVLGHGEQPSAKDVGELVERAKTEGAVAIISEIDYDHGFGVVIAEETGLPLISLRPVPAADETYLEFLANNIDTFFKGLN